MTPAVGDASPKTLKVINTRQLSRAVRVYNLEIESRPGEITHNYLVGDQLVWVHNARTRRRVPNDISRDSTGRVHDLTDDIPNNLSGGDLDDAIDELEQDREERRNDLCRHGGGDAGHNARYILHLQLLRRLLGRR